MNSTIYVSAPSSPFPNVDVKSQTGEIVQVQWSKVYFHGFKYLVNEAKFQYLNSDLPRHKLIYIAFRSQILLFTRNPSLAIRELFVGLEGKIVGEVSLPIELIQKNLKDEKFFWVSRSGVVQGVKSRVYGPEIDWDRIRYSKVYKCFVWGLNQTKDQIQLEIPNFKLSTLSVEVEHKENIESLKIIESIRFIRLLNCFVYNGVFTIKDDKVFLTDTSHAIEQTAWPTNKVGLSQGRYVVIEAHETVTPRLSKAIFLGSSPSWYHFLVEIFPRFLHLIEVTSERSTVVTRGSLPKSILQIFAEIGFIDVQSIGDGQRIEVEEVITVADFRFKNALDLEARTSDILLVRDFFRTRYSVVKSQEMFYLKRSRHFFRPLYGQKKVEKFLVSLGFHVLLPEELDFHAQREFLGNAKVLVAASGAALTSMLFVPEHCKVVQIHDGEDQTDLWERFSKILGLDMTVINGRRFAIYNLITGAGLYRINLKQFKSIIRDIVSN